MCMITYIPQGVEIPVEGIKNGSYVNDDGHGWAVASSEGLVVGKSMDFEEALQDFLDTRSMMSGSAAMFHSRYGTHGVMGEYNVHPFPVGQNGGVVAHNGVLPSQFLPHAKDPRSDTRVFADSIGWMANTERGVPSRRTAAKLAEIIGSHNKLVFMASTPLGPAVRIVNAWAGIWTGGVWFSNTGYEDAYWRRWENFGKGKPIILGSADDDDETVRWWLQQDEEVCPSCKSLEVDRTARICDECFTCLDCAGDVSAGECMCYTPNTAKAEVEGKHWDTYDKVNECALSAPF